ncbi:MAG TPA: tyrosine-type recombinase/integrase [Verrucomicrobiae bacterium]|nr:tyrosine-type recombinase/integrase [Verrucomicrobiae bacterium]
MKFRNPETDAIEQISTGFNTGDARQYLKAVQMRNEYAVKETNSAKANALNPFSKWAPDYIKTTHANSPGTLKRYLSTWNLLAAYFSALKITAPAQVRRSHCLEYVTWRSDVRHLNNSQTEKGKHVGRNTIILELRVLHKIMQEAVNREFIIANPASRLGLKKDPSRVKDEISDEQFALIEDEVKRRLRTADTPKQKLVADYLFVSWEIARLQGIRLKETHIRLDRINFAHGSLPIKAKGNKFEDVPINPNLLPFLHQLKKDGRTYTYEMPKHPAQPWFKVFKRLRKHYLGFENISFHSTRVTAITRMERAGVPETVMMKAVTHASPTVHRVYRRIDPKELAPYWNALNVKKPGETSASKNPKHENQD